MSRSFDLVNVLRRPNGTFIEAPRYIIERYGFGKVRDAAQAQLRQELGLDRGAFTLRELVGIAAPAAGEGGK